MTNIKDWEDIT